MERASESPLLDRQALLTLREYRVPGAPDPAGEVARAFLDVTPARLQNLRRAASAGDVATVQQLAHQVRGSCGAVGATAMSEVATALEAGHSIAELLPLVGELDRLFQRTRPLLDDFAQRDDVEIA
jgi:HPt (histidine-containing phosphotransfer) domain-containing protein